MFSIETIAVLIIGYLIGSIPWAVIIAKRAGVDIFSVGSGNPGATNVLRTLGKPMGYSVFVLDFLKGVLAVCWFQFPLFSFSGDLTLGLWGLPAAVLWAYLSDFHGVSRRKRGRHGHGRITGCNACLLIGWFVCMATYLLPYQVCGGRIDCFWTKPPCLFPGFFCE